MTPRMDRDDPEARLDAYQIGMALYKCAARKHHGTSVSASFAPGRLHGGWAGQRCSDAGGRARPCGGGAGAHLGGD